VTVQLVSLDVPGMVRDPQRYYDRTVQAWHREQAGPRHRAIDLDLLDYCARCEEMVTMIEAATAPADTKPVRVLAKAARRARVAALLVEHQDGVVTRWRPVVYPPGADGTLDWHPASTLKLALDRLLDLHLSRECEA
jgi:hypothetical protein